MVRQLLYIILIGILGCFFQNADEYFLDSFYCQQKEDSINDGLFTYDKTGHIILPVKINGIRYDCLFDTGTTGTIILDKHEFASMSGSAGSLPHTSDMLHVDLNETETAIRVNYPLEVLVGGVPIHFDYYLLGDIKKKMGTPVLMAIPENDKHVWNIDYDHTRINVYEYVPIPVFHNCCFAAGMDIADRLHYVRIPMTFEADDETFYSDFEYLIDTGFGGDLLIMGQSDEVDSLHEKVRCLVPGYEVSEGDSIFLLKGISPVGDIMKLEKDENKNTDETIIGNRFMSHFDVWLDYAASMIYLIKSQDYKCPERVYCERNAPCEMFTQRVRKGLIVDYVCPTSPLATAGIERGDLIKAIDGTNPDRIGRNVFNDLRYSPVCHTITIERHGTTMILQVFGCSIDYQSYILNSI